MKIWKRPSKLEKTNIISKMNEIEMESKIIFSINLRKPFLFKILRSISNNIFIYWEFPSFLQFNCFFLFHKNYKLQIKIKLELKNYLKSAGFLDSSMR